MDHQISCLSPEKSPRDEQVQITERLGVLLLVSCSQMGGEGGVNDLKGNTEKKWLVVVC